MPKKNESGLKDHKQNKKELNPPFLASGLNLSTSAWHDNRLPEMLWAVLIIGNLEREKALTFFRYISKFVEENNDASNITITGISDLKESTKSSLIKHICNFSKDTKEILRALLLFPQLPSIETWKEHLEAPDPKVDWNKVGISVEKTFWHQSQEATDCRWIKVLCEIVGGKVSFGEAIGEDYIKGILEYPNFGDMRSVRPSIRSFEISMYNNKSSWAQYFWEYCYFHTACVPEEAVNKKIQDRQKVFSEEVKNARQFYSNDMSKLRRKLINYFFKVSETSSDTSRYEGVFGITIYALSLYIENIFYSTSLSITGRLGLRALVETYIVFLYLLKKEKVNPKIWDEYRVYGTGQIKLIYLKMQEIKKSPTCINIEEMDLIANEDKWIEFTPINLGHWDSVNLRKMSEEVGLKNIYDKYYNYTSGFMHGNWGSIRESVYQKCVNPLHHYHIIPTYELPLMPSITEDAREIMNKILGCLSKAYPTFNKRLSKISKKR